MQNGLIACLLTLLTCSYSWSQQKPEVGLKSGEVLMPESVQFKDPLFKSKHLLINRLDKIELGIVDYFNTGTDYFIVRNIDFAKNQEMRRIENGEISVFTYLAVSYSPGYMGPNGMMGVGGSRATPMYYYQIDNELRKMNVYNLELDMKHDPSSIAMIQQFQRKRYAGIGLWVVGGVMTLVGLNQMVDKANENGPPYEDPLKVNGLFVSGLVVAAVPFFIFGNKNAHLLKVIRTYNINSKKR